MGNFKLVKCEAIDVSIQISRAGLSHPARVLTNQIPSFTVIIIAAERASAAAVLIYAIGEIYLKLLGRIALWYCAVCDAQFTVLRNGKCFHSGSSFNGGFPRELYLCCMRRNHEIAVFNYLLLVIPRFYHCFAVLSQTFKRNSG